MLSYWEFKHLMPQADVFILGEGIVGFSAAITLKERYPDLTICIIEAYPIGQGASTKNAGFACYGSMTEILDDMDKLGEEEVWKLVKMRWDGLQILRNRFGDDSIKYEALGGFELFDKNDRISFERCADNIHGFNKIMKELIGQENTYSIKNQYLNEFGLNSFGHLILNSGEGQLNTGLLYRAFLQKVNELGILNFKGFKVASISYNELGGVLLCNDLGWSIEVPKLVVATNGFTQKLLPKLDIKGARNQVLVTQPIKNLKIKGAFHFDRGYYYFRDVDGRILLGGARNIDFEGETTTEFGLTDKIINPLKEFLTRKILNNFEVKIDYMWSGILGIGNEKSPIVRKFNKDLVVAVRMGGMGVAIGSLVGQEAAHLIVEK